MAESTGVQTRVPSVLEDPSAQSIARVYANAFLAAAQGVGVAKAFEEFESFLRDVVDRNPEFARILYSGLLGRDEKVALIDRIFTKRGSEFFVNFLRVLARHERLDLLPHILREAQLKNEQASNKRRVQVRSARELTDEMKERIRRRLADTMHFDPILETRVDPSLIGGVIIRIGDTIYDSTLRSRMKQLRERLRHRSLHEIQSGRDRFSHTAGN